jgi:hypothetical protein
MRMEGLPIFTLQEANAVLPEVIRLTEEVIERLVEMQSPWGRLPFRKYDALRGIAEEDWIRAEWARQIAALGIAPKGYFVVDFQSPEPDTFYCWSYGEETVSHEHKIWETFAHRRFIRDGPQADNKPPSPPWQDTARDETREGDVW